SQATAQQSKRHSLVSTLAIVVSRIRRYPSILWRLEARLKGVEFRGKCEFIGRPLISIAPTGRIVIGRGAAMHSSTRANPLACFQPCVLRALAPGSQVILGDAVGLSGTVLCAGASIEVGEGTIFGSGAMVIDNDFHVPQGEWRWSNDANICGSIA